MPGIISTTLQFLCPSKPRIVEKDVPDLTGKVAIVTGSNTGLGKEIAQILYSKNARVYLLARSEEKTKKAIESIKAAVPKSSGTLTFIHLDLADLTSIRATADAFHSHESQLHLLFNNAGVAMPAGGSKTKQGYELQMGVNCLGSFALTKLLTPTLVATSKAVSQPGSVRVVWVSSNASEAVSPRDFVKSAENVDKMVNPLNKYGFSKLGNYLHACEFAAQAREHGIVSMPVNPGALDSDLWRDQMAVVRKFLQVTLLHPPVYGAYTCLYAAFSPEVTLENSGTYIAPWGKLWKVAPDMIKAGKRTEDGGDGTAKEFWKWSDAQVSKYL